MFPAFGCVHPSRRRVDARHPDGCAKRRVRCSEDDTRREGGKKEKISENTSFRSLSRFRPGQRPPELGFEGGFSRTPAGSDQNSHNRHVDSLGRVDFPAGCVVSSHDITVKYGVVFRVHDRLDSFRPLPAGVCRIRCFQKTQDAFNACNIQPSEDSQRIVAD